MLAFVTAPSTIRERSGTPVEINQVMAIFQERCNSCHSSNPVDDIWVVAPSDQDSSYGQKLVFDEVE